MLLIKVGQPGFEYLDFSVDPPLGILYLSTIARQAGCSVEILDLRIIDSQKIRYELDKKLELNPFIIGLSALSYQVKDVDIIASYIKRKYPGAFLVAGGPLATADTDYVLQNLPVDLCVTGEGEQAFAKLLEGLSEKKEWQDIPGIAYRQGDKIIKNSKAELPFDSLPLPAWDLVDFDRYAHFPSMGQRVGRRAMMQTSRGCPYHCSFCQRMFGSRFRARTPENVLSEIDILYQRYGIRRIEFIDETFSQDYQRATAILKEIRDNYPDLNISFPNGMRGDQLDELFIKLLKDAGCNFIGMGVESGSGSVQARINKNLDLTKIKNTAALLDKYCIPTCASFVLGFPGETRAEMEETIDFAKSLKGVAPFFGGAIPLGGTKLHEQVFPDRGAVNPECINPVLGRRPDKKEEERFALALEKAQRLTRQRLLRPRYWFFHYSIIHWLFYSSQWKLLALKIVSSTILPANLRLKIKRHFGPNEGLKEQLSKF